MLVFNASPLIVSAKAGRNCTHACGVPVTGTLGLILNIE